MSIEDNAVEPCPACVDDALDKSLWVACSHCTTWFHVACLRIDNIDDYDTWYCAPCLSDASLQLAPRMRRKSTRERAKTDYAAIEEGRPSDPLGRWARLLALYDPPWPTSVQRVDGATWTQAWLASAPDVPVIVPAGSDVENPGSHIPGLRIPPRSTTIRDVARMVGPDTHVEVIDVKTQRSSRAWTLSEWADYFETPPAMREKLLNVISLEITGTPMQALVEAPRMVRESDWVERDWPHDRRPRADDASKWPKVQRYVLMGVQGAFTDFHIDFAASYVYYHVVWGHKVFLFAPPTAANLAAYKAWTSSAQQESEWLGHALHDVTRADIHTGETMLIPAGWIHAVHTPCDTLVIGGNFLADYHVAMHFRLEALEIATRVPRKFRFPHLLRLAWYVASGWHRRLAARPPPTLAPRVAEGIEQLCKRLEAEVHKMTTLDPASKVYQAACDAVPRDAVQDPAIAAP
ncbi:[histone H3]-dimethyl-L-lysine(36) demethylase [Malassezia nana]|uniref:JmjC domain-containing histone demethylation protein 1 n=1 Tax=Malassezia nana TaxID=180528 RepID=A0AAF0J4H3_9BASI|nr:[histone H3]-dimethyl-L-lysine(36) demethylase [Malassezia nana]